MAEIVNLRMARKRAVRRDEEAKASANRTAFGLPKAVREIAKTEMRRADLRLDGHALGRELDSAEGESDTGPAPSDVK